MEINCLRLTYNEVTVSLQQAYSLLLSGKISFLHYKVYASLSRLGYKVFRHDSCQPTDYEKKINLISSKNVVRIEESEAVKHDTGMMVNEVKEGEVDDEIQSNVSDCGEESCDINEIFIVSEVDNVSTQTCILGENMSITAEDNSRTNIDQSEFVNSEDDSHKEDIVSDLSFNQDKTNQNSNMEIDKNVTKDCEIIASSSQVLPEQVQNIISGQENAKSTNFQTVKNSKLQDLQKRKLKPCNNKEIVNLFTNVPDLYQKRIVTIKIPEEQHIPKNVFLNNISYVLNLESIRANIKYSRPHSNDSRAYSVSEEVNGPHVLRVSDAASNITSSNNWAPFYHNSGFPRHQFRQFQFWRPRQYNFSWRPFLPSIYFVPRVHFYPRQPPPLYRPQANQLQRNFNKNNNRNQSKDNANTVNGSRKRKTKQYHLDHIQRLSSRLKQLVQAGNTHTENRVALQRLIETFNTRYNARLRLTPQLDLIEDEVIIATIELEDEDEISRKRPRTEEIDLTKYDENLEMLKKFSSKLKDLEASHKSCSRHRRAFSHLVKKFNKSYDADVYVNDNYEVFDRTRIILDDSSDSDCILDDTPSVSCKKNERTTETFGKKLKNPFNILKKLSEKNKTSLPSCSEDGPSTENTDKSNKDDNEYSENTTTVFDRNWLPSKEDFGRAEIPAKGMMYDFLMSSKRDEYIYDFIKNQRCEFVNWLEAKIAFLRDVEVATAAIEKDIANQIEVKIDSIIKPDDCIDMPSVLKKLSIIQTHKEEDSRTDLIIDFDVYNRDVQNFKKSNKPKPHFRVICTSENYKFPSGSDVDTIHAQYEDNVPILFAIVGVGSVSYLQINPNNLPMYISSNDLT
ncbi:uncharacterized protein LOC113233785 isoform X2 [Hyposmocoma kahamanoa]|nr:uncharacterized protein LOC113233785 isoform X2 [Hyposmocoma kahamanoa]